VNAETHQIGANGIVADVVRKNIKNLHLELVKKPVRCLECIIVFILISRGAASLS
jgi:hypothetical protein